MKKIQLIILAVVVLGLGGVVFLSFRSTHPESTNGDGSRVVARDDTEEAGMTAEESAAETAAQQAAVSSVKAAIRYSHKAPDFSFDKPEGYTVGALPSGDGGQTLVIQRSSPSEASAKDGQSGFQIVITPLDEPMTLTPDLIKSELPGTSVSNPLEINLDGRGRGMMFASNNDAFGGKSYEIWFATPTHLYQITSYTDFATQLQQIIGTWKFN